jgi:glutamate racemase
VRIAIGLISPDKTMQDNSPESRHSTTAQPGHPVVVMDSGVGGLSVLRSLLQQLPSEPFIYLADSAHVPYGDKPQDFIVERTLALAKYARDDLQAKALVIACNTATAAAVSQVRSQWPDWVVVGIEPAVKPAAHHTQRGVMGILATSNTLASQKFQALVEEHAAGKQVVVQACPGLVECIESGDLESPRLKSLLSSYVQALLDQHADVIVLGCTHYPFLTRLIAAQAGPDVEILETGGPVARETRRRLAAAGLLRQSPDAPPAPGFLTTGDPQALSRAVRDLLGLQSDVRGVTC